MSYSGVTKAGWEKWLSPRTGAIHVLQHPGAKRFMCGIRFVPGNYTKTHLLVGTCGSCKHEWDRHLKRLR